MKDIELNYVDIGGAKYPIYCDLNVLEIIQDNYESINKFERDLLGLTPLRSEDGELQRDDKGLILNKTGEPKIKAVALGLFLMIREGQRIDTRQTGTQHEELTAEELREITSVPFTDLANVLHDEFNRCFNVKKKLTTRTRRSRKKSTS